jgi:peptidoglycan hydrolase CwlO-like protein
MISKKVLKLQKEINELIKNFPESTERIEHLKNQIRLEHKRFWERKKYCNELLKK